MSEDLVTSLAPAVFGFLGTVAGAVIAWLATNTSHRSERGNLALAACFDLMMEAVRGAGVQEWTDLDEARLNSALKTAIVTTSAAGLPYNIFAAALAPEALSPEHHDEDVPSDDQDAAYDAHEASMEACFIASQVMIQFLQLSWFKRAFLRSSDGPKFVVEAVRDVQPQMKVVFGGLPVASSSAGPAKPDDPSAG